MQYLCHLFITYLNQASLLSELLPLSIVFFRALLLTFRRSKAHIISAFPTAALIRIKVCEAALVQAVKGLTQLGSEVGQRLRSNGAQCPILSPISGGIHLIINT